MSESIKEGCREFLFVLFCCGFFVGGGFCLFFVCFHSISRHRYLKGEDFKNLPGISFKR